MSSPKVLFGFHAVGVRMKTAPKSIIEVYFESTRRDARMRQFIERAKAFRDAVDAAQAAQATSCDALGAAMSGIGGTCKGCHDDFR